MTEAEQKFIALIRQCIQGALNEGVPVQHVAGALEWESKSLHSFAMKQAESPIIKPPGR